MHALLAQHASELSPWLLVAAGAAVVLVILLLTSPAVRRRGGAATTTTITTHDPAATPAQPAANPFRTSATRSGEHRALEREIHNLIQELSDLTRRVNAQIAQVDERSARLEQLLRAADERAARLRALHVAANGDGDAAAIPPHLTPATEAPLASSSSDDVIDPRHVEIYTLCEQGLSTQQIAERLHRPSGEVELIIALRPRKHALGASRE